MRVTSLLQQFRTFFAPYPDIPRKIRLKSSTISARRAERTAYRTELRRLELSRLHCESEVPLYFELTKNFEINKGRSRFILQNLEMHRDASLRYVDHDFRTKLEKLVALSKKI